MQDLSGARRTLRIAGILSIILGAIALFIAVSLLACGGFIIWQFATADAVDSTEELPVVSAASLFLLSGTILAIPGIAHLTQGYFSLRATGDSGELRAACISSVAGLVLAAIGFAFVLAFDLSASAAIVSAVSLALSGVIFWAAKSCRDRTR